MDARRNAGPYTVGQDEVQTREIPKPCVKEWEGTRPVPIQNRRRGDSNSTRETSQEPGKMVYTHTEGPGAYRRDA